MNNLLYKVIGLESVYAQGAADPLVKCGNSYEVSEACKINDLLLLANNIGVFALSVILPLVFFIGLFMAVLPILKDPNVPGNIAQAKSNFIKLAIGTALIAGSYMLVRVVLSSIGVKEEVLNKVISEVMNTPILTIVYADTVFTNPLENLQVQGVISGIVNTLVFFLVLAIILGIMRGVFLLLLSQENPEFLKRGKKWIVYSLIVAAIVFGSEMIYNIIVNTATSITK